MQPDLSANAPWKQRFRAPQIYFSEIARDNPAKGLVSSSHDGIAQLYAWDVRRGGLRQLTHDPAGRKSAVLSPDGNAIYYIQDTKGNEMGHYVRLPYQGGDAEDITPQLPEYFSSGFDVRGDTLVFIAIYDNTFHLYALRGDTFRLLHKTDHLIVRCKLSADGRLVCLMSTERSGKLQGNLPVFHVQTGEKIADLYDAGESLTLIDFAPDDGRVLASTTKYKGLTRPVIWHPRTEARKDFPLPELHGEVYPLCWSLDGRRILVLNVYQAMNRMLALDTANGRTIPLAHPSGTYTGATYFDPGSGDIFTEMQSSTRAVSVIALDPESGAFKRTVLAGAENLPESSAWRSVAFPSSDGQMIQAWLATPDGHGPFPTIVHIHGGPEMVMTDSYSPESQMWLDHGFAFITVNYRGSTTFGRDFLEKIWFNPGTWELEDLVAARDYVVREGIADPEKVFLSGWSYGGYLTLYGLGVRPDLWAGGMAGVAVADWVSQYEDESEAMRAGDRAFFGGPPEEKMEAYVKASPITYVDRLQAPVLIIQGNNDTRCPARQIELYKAKAKEFGKWVEVHWFDAGHARLDTERLIQHHELMLQFACRIVG